MTIVFILFIGFIRRLFFIIDINSNTRMNSLISNYREIPTKKTVIKVIFIPFYWWYHDFYKFYSKLKD